MRGAADDRGRAGATRGARPPRAAAGDRADLWIPLAYALVAGGWIAFSDRLVAAAASSVAQQAAWSMAKGIGFVLVTAALLHLGVRRALARERRASLALGEREALLRAISDASPDPIFVKDRESRWLFANPAVLRVIGKPAEQVLGRTDLEIYPDPVLAEALMAADRRVVESGSAEILEERVETPAGVRLFLSSKAPYRDRDGRIIGVVGTARDVTERSEAEARFRALIEKATDVLVVLDAEARIVFWSPGATQALGFTADEVMGQSIFDHIHPDALPAAREAFARMTAAPGAVARLERLQRHKDGSWRLLDVTGRNLLHDPAVRGFVANMRDVTEQRRVEAGLHQAQKLESVGRLAGGVAHDFNNLLTVILSGAEALGDGLAAGHAADPELVDEIRAAGERARDLTARLLAFARKQVIAPVPLDLNAVVGGAERLLRRVLGEDVQLRVDLAPGLWTAVADPGQLEQVILNLAVNARDAMPDGGALVIETRNVPGAAAGQADHVALTVRDSGVGMSDEVKAHLFEPFFTTKPAGAGTGLGLATVYGIVRQLGGEVHVESEPGRGTRVEVRLPRSDAPARAAPAPVRAEAVARGDETILVIEDDPQVRDVTVRALRGAGYRVLVAADGAGALELVERGEGRPELVVTDVVMPGYDGRVVVDELRRRHGAGIRALFVSGYTQEVIHHHGVLDSGVEFLPKPFTPGALLARVREVLDAA